MLDIALVSDVVAAFLYDVPMLIHKVLFVGPRTVQGNHLAKLQFLLF